MHDVEPDGQRREPADGGDWHAAVLDGAPLLAATFAEQLGLEGVARACEAGYVTGEYALMLADHLERELKRRQRELARAALARAMEAGEAELTEQRRRLDGAGLAVALRTHDEARRVMASPGDRAALALLDAAVAELHAHQARRRSRALADEMYRYALRLRQSCDVAPARRGRAHGRRRRQPRRRTSRASARDSSSGPGEPEPPPACARGRRRRWSA